MPSTTHSGVFDSPQAVRDHFAALRAKGSKLVTTNGCFDIIHAGHVRYLAEAKAVGDILVVGINADSSVKKLKGPDRPLQNEADRAFIVASLKMVDATFVFAENDPCEFVEIIRPDFHVKGGDYSKEMIETPVVEKHGGKVIIVSLHKGYSTTSIVKKMRPE